MNSVEITPGCEVRVFGGDVVHATISGRENIVEGECLVAICLLLKSKRATQWVIERLQEKFSYVEVLAGIKDLQTIGIIRLSNSEEFPFSGARQAEQTKSMTAVCLEGFSDVLRVSITNALALAEVSVQKSAATILYCQAAPGFLRDAPISRRCWGTGKQLFPVTVSGNRLLLGPLFRPGLSPCWDCLAFRHERNTILNRFAGLECKVISGEPTRSPLSTPFGAQLVAFEVSRTVGTEKPPEITEWDLEKGTVLRHRVLQRFGCTLCGYGPGQTVRAAPASDGPSRVDFEELFSSRAHIVSPLTGAVTEIEDISAGNLGWWFAYNAKHYFPSSDHSAAAIIRSLKVGTGGKGESRARAKLGALAESVERISLIFDGSEERISATYSELGAGAIDLRSCLNFSQTQYAQREGYNRTAGHFNKVPAELDPQLTVDWTALTSMTTGKSSLIPSAYCYYGHPDATVHRYCFADSNGCAAGIDQSDAIFRALIELIERDAVAIWWYNRLHMAGIDLNSFDDPYIDRIQEYYASIGREIWAIDVTTDIRVPVVVAVSRRTTGPTEDLIFGSGSGLCADDALSSAVAELNQFLPAVIRNGSDGSTQYRFPYPEGPAWWRAARSSSERYLTVNPDIPLRRKNQFADRRTGQSARDVIECLARLAEQNLEAFFLDATKPELEFDVVRVVVPGLRHFWRRLGSGRLYDVPVNLGLRDVPLRETDTNSWSIFY